MYTHAYTSHTHINAHICTDRHKHTYSQEGGWPGWVGWGTVPEEDMLKWVEEGSMTQDQYAAQRYAYMHVPCIHTCIHTYTHT